MLYRANVAIGSEKSAKHINTVWQNVKILMLKPVGALHNQLALKGFFLPQCYHMSLMGRPSGAVTLSR
jgi:hypothetical protein